MSKRSIGVLLFDEFELLDVFGPLEMYGMQADAFNIWMVSEEQDVIASRQGPRSIIDHRISDGYQYDILFIPGGTGTRREVNNPALLHWINEQADLCSASNFCLYWQCPFGKGWCFGWYSCHNQ